MGLGARFWTVPAERADEGAPHRVPLSNPALAALETARANAPAQRRSVLPSAKPGQHLSIMTRAAVLKRGSRCR